ncbi:hypothetical protein L208DRAFT_1295703 [Tricholoma matsutake]|nr:hypothetical protein L208DRAFT_1295703 [Tricholoma matsutake 945]
MSNQCWRSLLNYGGTVKDMSANGLTKSSQLWLEVQELLGNCLDEAGVAMNMSFNSSVVFWCEAQLSVGALPDCHVTQEILWELYELNFQFKLVALDQWAWLASVEELAAQESSCQLMLMACFPSKSLLVADVLSTNQGFASPTLKGHSCDEEANERMGRECTGGDLLST